MYQLPSLTEPAESSSVKCAKCEGVTEHQYIKIQPEPTNLNETIDVMEFLKLAKRLLLCTKCGNMRLTN